MKDTAEFNQRPEESMEDWRYRVIFSKVKKECKLSWEDICDLLGLKCRGEYLRKIAYGVSKYDSYLKEKKDASLTNHRAQVELSELESKEFAMRREKMRMQDQKRELNKLLREWARAEHIEKTIKDAVNNTTNGQKLIQVKQSLPDLDQHKRHEAALLLSDWHIGMYTDNVNNRFNETVFEERINELLSQAVYYGKMNHVTHFHVFALGDLVNGLIHVTTRINNTENVIKQTMKAAETLCRILGTLSQEFEEVTAYFSRGNHDRVTANKKESIAGESFFDTIPWYVSARLSEFENIKIEDNSYDEEIVVANILNNKIFAVHGHQDKPSTVVQNLSAMLKQFPDYIFMGHYHSSAEREVAGAEVIINSSLCGTDDYAISLRRTAKPAQKLLIFDNQGRVCTYNIRLEAQKG